MQRFLPALVFLLMVRPAWGHPMPSSSVVLRLHRFDMKVELTLPIGELALGWEKPLPLDSVRRVREFGAEFEDYVRAHVGATSPDGQPWTVKIVRVLPLEGQEPDVRVELTMTPPRGSSVDRLTFHYDLIFHHLVTHTAVVTLASDWRGGLLGEESLLLGTMRDTSPDIAIDRSGCSWFRGFSAMFRLGARHIAEGTDHLLFLLALILPASLIAKDGRWDGYAGWKVAFGRMMKVVTAFTVGHSITLVLGVFGWVRLPNGLVESAIALSILVSAIHALTPVFRGREVFVAGGFGLVHGLAFAATLSDFGLDPWTMVSSVLGFNLGIEAVQLLVIVTAMPWLVLLARSSIYSPFRITGAIFTGIAATAWLAERALGWDNRIVGIVETIASHFLWVLTGLIVLSVAVTIAESQRRKSPEIGRNVAPDVAR